MRVFGLLLIAGCGRIGFPHAPDAASEISGLLVHLPLDELFQGTTPDASGNQHAAHCTAGQCPILAPGEIGNAAMFDGSVARLQVDDASDLHLPAGFTVAAWVQLAAAPMPTGCPYQKIVGAQDQNSWELCVQPDLSAYFFSSESLFSGNGNILTATTVIAAGPWHHTAIVWDATQRRKEIWLDGQRIGESEGVALPPAFDAGPIMLGLDLDFGSPRSAFPGALDDFRLYDHALTPGELATLAAP